MALILQGKDIFHLLEHTLDLLNEIGMPIYKPHENPVDQNYYLR